MKLSWSPRARADLDRIWFFLAGRDLALADRIDMSIRTRAEVLTDFPRLGRRMMRDIHEWTITEIQYVVTYRIEAGFVRILRVHHTRENRERP